MVVKEFFLDDDDIDEGMLGANGELARIDSLPGLESVERLQTWQPGDGARPEAWPEDEGKKAWKDSRPTLRRRMMPAATKAEYLNHYRQ